MRNDGGGRPRAMTVGTAPRNVVSREDLRLMSDESILYLENRLMAISQAGNANGPMTPPVTGSNRLRGNPEELRDRAVDRMYTRTSNRVHSGEINNMASGLMRERMERNLRWRK